MIVQELDKQKSTLENYLTNFFVHFADKFTKVIIFFYEIHLIGKLVRYICWLYGAVCVGLTEGLSQDYGSDSSPRPARPRLEIFSNLRQGREN
jgi:hypothetical protein